MTRPFSDNVLTRDLSDRGALVALLLLAIALLTLLTGYVNAAKMRYMNSDYVNWKYQKEFLDGAGGEHNDFIVLGDSRAMAGFDPLVATELRTRNLALGGSSTIEAYYALKRYLKTNTTDSIILSIAPHHLATMDVFWSRTIKFRFLTPAETREVLARDSETNAPAFADKSFPMLYYYASYLPFEYRAELRNSFEQNRRAINDAVYKVIVEHRGLQFQGQQKRNDKLSYDTKVAEIDVIPILDDYLQDIVALARENNIRLFWYTAPINKPSCEALQPGFEPSFERFLNKLETDLGITVLQGIHCLDPEFFGDRGHVNRRGATLNSELMVELYSQARAQSD